VAKHVLPPLGDFSEKSFSPFIQMAANCPGLFGGRIPVRLGISCSMIHVLLGFVAWWLSSSTIVAVFVVYQFTQHLFEDKPFDLNSTLWDIGEFAAGILIPDTLFPLVS
jgi:hypothetical protein